MYDEEESRKVIDRLKALEDDSYGVLDFIMDKYDIVVDFFSEHFVLTSFLIASIILGSTVGIAEIKAKQIREQNAIRYKKYISTTIDTENGSYNICNVYVVYNAEKVWFCNRKLVAINEEEVLKGSTRYGTGNISEYYYRDEIYEYYDLKNGEKICQTHEDGFYIEYLPNLYSEKHVMKHNYQLSLDDLEKEKNIKYMLSRDPGLKRK